MHYFIIKAMQEEDRKAQRKISETSMLVFSLDDLLREYFDLGQLESEVAAATIIFALAVIIGWIVYLVFKDISPVGQRKLTQK